MTTHLDVRPESGPILPKTEEILTSWLLYERQRGLSAATVTTYRLSMQTYLSWITSDGPTDSPVPMDILAYKDYLANQYKPASVNLKLSAVRSFYRWLVVTGRIQASPASEIQGVRRADSHTHKRDALTSSEANAILDQCDTSPEGKRNRAILTLMLYCALRTIEVVRANVDNLKTMGNRMVMEVWGKGRLEPDEIVVIPRDQEHVIRAWVAERMRIMVGDSEPLFVSLSRQTRGQRISTRGVRYTVKGIYANAGIFGARKTTHSLRHTAITKAIEGGADLLAVQSMARHNSFDTTKRYFHEVGRVTNPAEDLIDYD